MTNKKEQQRVRAKRHYDKNKARITEQRTAKKTYFQFIEELTEESKRQCAKFIIENTPNEKLSDEKGRAVITQAFRLFERQEGLTESETLQIRKNKRLVQRWQAFLKALEQHIEKAIDKKVGER